MISIVIPLYNKALQVGKTLQSVFSQSFSDYEIIVVNDGSTDGSEKIVAMYHDPRLRLITMNNQGAAAARNRGIREAKGEIIAFLDADDYWLPCYLATINELAQTFPDCDVFATNYKFQDANGNVRDTIIRHLPFETRNGVLDNYFEVASSSHPPLQTSTVSVRRAKILEIGGFPNGIRWGEDLLTWARLAVCCKIAYCCRPLGHFLYDEKIFNSEQRRRLPERKDMVAEELTRMYQSYPEIHHMKDYVGLWHKMRARRFLLKGHRARAVKECWKSLEYKFSGKPFVFITLAGSPQFVIRRAFRWFGRT